MARINNFTKFKNPKKIILILIFLLALFLRTYKTSSIPHFLNRDEADIGYNAYVLLKTAKDEHAKLLPFFFESFGDWKMPVYIYLTIPFIFLFNLSIFSVRFLSGLAGSLTVILVYFLVKKTFPKNKNLSIIASLLLALSPWHIHFSRQAYEVNLALFFISMGSLLFFKKKYLLSLAFFIISLFTYHGTTLFVLSLYLFLVFISKTKSFFKSKQFYYFLFLALIFFLSQLGGKKAIKDKFLQTTVFRDKSIYLEKIFLIKQAHKSDRLTANIFHNQAVEGFLSYSENYFSSLSLPFLFFGNDLNARFLIGKKSLRLNYLVLIPFYFWGLFLIVKKRKRVELFWLFWYLSIPILPSFLVRTPSGFRNFGQVIPLIVIISLGLDSFIVFCKKLKFSYLVFIILSLVWFGDILKISENYINHVNGGYDYYYKEIIDNFNYWENKRNKPLILKITKPEFSPYIFTAFYQKIEPSWFLDNVEWYPLDDEGFRHVKSITSKYQFGSIDWNGGDNIDRDIVYVDLFYDLPGEIKEKAGIDSRIIKDKSGQPLFFQFIY